ncbi:MAG: hypothetical protein LBB09_03315 [Rickettsiales bacterium]|jgi:hypothetical protein|nr:hypothetical protein [Rickettsiales bacterium]
MHFNVLYHFYMPHRRAIFAKAATEAAVRERGAMGAMLAGRGPIGFLEAAYRFLTSNRVKKCADAD